MLGLTKRFGMTLAVDAIDLVVPANSYCCLLGPSGCGKLTTLRMIAGHETATAGDVILGGRNVTDLPPAKRGTAMMFQFYALFPHLSALDNVAFSLKVRGVDARTRRARTSIGDSLRVRANGTGRFVSVPFFTAGGGQARRSIDGS